MKTFVAKCLVPSAAVLALALLQCSANDALSPQRQMGGSSGGSGSTGAGGDFAGAGGSPGSGGDTTGGSAGVGGVSGAGGAIGEAGAGGGTGGGGSGGAGIGGTGGGGFAGTGGGGTGGAAGSGGTNVGGSGARGGTGGGGSPGSGGTTVDAGSIDNGPAPATYTDSKGVAWKLVWHDEFDGSTVNTANWAVQDYCNVQNGELQCYHPANVTIQNGVLVLEAREESGGGKNYTSGKVTSRDKQSFTYGRLSARMKLPALTGMWPAFWMLGNGGRWPQDGEIDIMEARGRVPNQVVGTGHWGSNNSNYGKDYTFPTGQDFTGWHVYSIEWNSTSINWYVDDAPFYVTLSPMDACFTKAFYFILNLAVGGNFDGMKAPAANMPNQQALVDWVRVYQLQ